MNKAMQKDEIFESFLESEFISRVEEAMNCSGFCANSLFYFSKSTENGYPDETCLEKIVDYLIKICNPLEKECDAIGGILVGIFFMHFTFYGRKKPV